MKQLLPFLLIALLATACGNASDKVMEQQIKEAEAARKTSDSILQEFKKINEGLTQTKDSLQQLNDSLLKKYDTAAGVGAFRTVPRTP